MPIDTYPVWAEPNTVDVLETAIDLLITHYADSAGITVESPEEYGKIARLILPTVYSTVEAQIESAVNARAYVEV